MNDISPSRPSVLRRTGRHLRRNAVAYLALTVAVSISPVPAWAAAKIGTADLKNGAVTTKKLAKNAVKPAKIANNAITSPKIKDGSVQKADLAASALGFTKVVTRRTSTANVPSGEVAEGSPQCSAGEVAIGGGGYVSPGGFINFGGSGGQIQYSHPVNPFTVFFPNGTAPSGDNVAPTGWRTAVLNDAPENRTVFFYAICASK